jgi:hypothetical protein
VTDPAFICGICGHQVAHPEEPCRCPGMPRWRSMDDSVALHERIAIMADGLHPHDCVVPAELAAEAMACVRRSSPLPRIAVFGGRDYTNRRAVFRALSALLERKGPFVVVEGGARGADALAGAWVREVGLPVLHDVHPANWALFKGAAGPRRNKGMAYSELAGAVGFPGGRGTADMARQLEAAGVAVWWPKGAPTP